MIFIAVVLLVVSAVSGQSEIADQLQTCNRHGPELNDCLKTSIQKALKVFANGYPKYNIPPIEPIEVEQSGTVPAGTVLNFDQKYHDMKLHDYSSVLIEDVKAKITGKKFSLNVTCYGKDLTVDGKYQYDNAFLDGVNLTSNGDVHYFYAGRRFYISMEGETVDEFLRIDDCHVDLLGYDSFEITFKSEDRETGERLTTIFNAKALELLAENREGYEAMYSNQFKSIANAIFAVIPYDKLFPEK